MFFIMYWVHDKNMIIVEATFAKKLVGVQSNLDLWSKRILQGVFLCKYMLLLDDYELTFRIIDELSSHGLKENWQMLFSVISLYGWSKLYDL